jgi:hypothetical protein
MRSVDHDLTLHHLRRLAVLQPDAARSERVRMRCHAAIADRCPAPGARALPPGRSRARVIESGLVWALSIGYVSAVIHDLLRVYLHR